MFRWFKRATHERCVVEETQGEYRGLVVVMRDFPCRVNVETGRRRFVTDGVPHEFGPDFLEAIFAAFNEQVLAKRSDPNAAYEEFRARLDAGESETMVIRIGELRPFTIEFSGRAPDTRRRFEEEYVLDAIMAAMDFAAVSP